MGFNRNTTLFCGIGKFKLVRRMVFSIVTPPPPLPETYIQLLTDNLELATGALSGYFFTQGFLNSNMARIKAQEAALTSGKIN